MRIIFSLVIISICSQTLAQSSLAKHLNQRGEIIVSISTESAKKIPNIQNYSIDKSDVNLTQLYLNKKQYTALKNLGVIMQPEAIPSQNPNATMSHTLTEAMQWNSYPDYDTYLSIMKQLALNYSEICQLDTIGYSINERLILALKISDNVSTHETEPSCFFTSSIHGDELTGYVLTLQLAEYLLKNYTKDRLIKELIDHIEIYINPLSNPDGTFAAGNHTVYGATRYNANALDLNRNYPDPRYGDHPDGNEWQIENIAMMNFMNEHHFDLSINFHGGAEVINYPWDYTKNRHADDTWYKFISRAYADTVHKYSTNYFTYLDNGITNGYDWYSIAGGRQDYCNHFLHGREVTAEISNTKLIDADELALHWEYNYRSMLHYMKEVLYGLHGLIIDELNNPIIAKIEILDHDIDSSFVYSDKQGIFYRFLSEGTYNIQISAPLYDTLELTNITIQNHSQNKQTFTLTKNKQDTTAIKYLAENDINIYPNPCPKEQYININTLTDFPWDYQLFNQSGQLITTRNHCRGTATINKNIKAGCYYLLIKQNNTQLSKKLIIY